MSVIDYHGSIAARLIPLHLHNMYWTALSYYLIYRKDEYQRLRVCSFAHAFVMIVVSHAYRARPACLCCLPITV